jgi:fatty-acyl-CoA synthase
MTTAETSSTAALPVGEDQRPATLDELLHHVAAAHPTREIVFPDERCTYRELDRRADDFATLLATCEANPGEHIGIWTAPSIALVAAIFGCFRVGAVAVPLSDRFRPDELAYVLEHSDSTILVTSPAAGPLDRPGDLTRALPSLAAQRTPRLDLPEAARLRRIVILGDAPSPAFIPAAELRNQLNPPAAAPRDTKDAPMPSGDSLAYLMYTSGTAAAPKGCMITHSAIVKQGESLASQRYMLDPDCAVWSPLPLFHIGGLATMTAALTAGASFVHAGVFEPGRALEMLRDEKVTHAIPAFDTIWTRILDHPAFGATDLSHLRVMMNLGGENQLRKLQARLPRVVQITNFGMTEAGGHLAMNRLDDPLNVRVTTCGLPLPDMQVRITDPETRAPVATGTRGEIEFRGPSRFVGYYRDDAGTAAVIDADGWFRSGDLGRLDPDGRLIYDGRLKDMLKVGGENVAALEVESFLARHPAVNIVAVISAPDAYYGEVPAAFIELTPGRTATEQEIIEFCLDQIATYKVPRYVRFVDHWPMSGTKIRKYVLREQIADELARSGITQAPKVRSRRSSAVEPERP